MPDPIRTTGRVIPIIRRAATRTVAKSYPTIIDPRSGSAVSGGSLEISVSTNRPEVTHTVRVTRADGTGTPATYPVTFPTDSTGNYHNPGTATVPFTAGMQDVEYILEVIPNDPPGGPSHSIVVTVQAANTPLAAAIDFGRYPPATYPPPLDLSLTGVGSGGTPNYTYDWTLNGAAMTSADVFGVRLTSSGSRYVVVCTATDATGATAASDPAVYDIS